MTLLGGGVLAIWNGIADERDGDFLEWHVKEHIPERVGVPGFLRGRRYKALDGDPAYFNFYEVSAPDVLRSAPYLARLNDPTPWTAKVVATFTDTSRTICRIEASAGNGVAALVEVLRFESHDEAGNARIAALVASLLAEPGVVGAHFLCRDEGPTIETSETRLRRKPDLAWAAVLIVEAVSRDAVTHLRHGALSDEAVRNAGFSAISGRGLYQLEFSLDEAELGQAAGRTAGPPKSR